MNTKHHITTGKYIKNIKSTKFKGINLSEAENSTGSMGLNSVCRLSGSKLI
jgi:hypothetical protein